MTLRVPISILPAFTAPLFISPFSYSSHLALSDNANRTRQRAADLPPAKAIQTGLGILLSVVKGVIDNYSALVDLHEPIGHFLNRLEIYIEIPPTEAMSEVMVKILVELLSTLALTDKAGKTFQ
ncbi:hypothetical protein V8E52_004695 [Russula decolorans]